MMYVSVLFFYLSIPRHSFENNATDQGPGIYEKLKPYLYSHC